ncbi:hypothetical protein Bbelb_430170 [Branchiostoma belcheri]|nr:hypothetical protein Bbelb_430170 [Branchiostoma belcheri]
MKIEPVRGKDPGVETGVGKRPGQRGERRERRSYYSSTGNDVRSPTIFQLVLVPIDCDSSPGRHRRRRCGDPRAVPAVTVKMNMNVRRRGQVMRSTFRTHRREQGETVMQPGGGAAGPAERGDGVAAAGGTAEAGPAGPGHGGSLQKSGKITTPRRVGRSVFQRFYYAVSCVDRKPVTHCDCGGVCQDKFSQFVALQIYKDDNNDIKVRPRLVEVPTCCELVIPS